MKARPSALKASRNSSGFTLIELMIVLAIIGLLATLALPMMSKARNTTQKTLCWENQRAVFDMVGLYEIEQGETLEALKDDGVGIRNQILAAGYIIRRPIFDCPTSAVNDFDDYKLKYSGKILQDIYCTIDTAGHQLP